MKNKIDSLNTHKYRNNKILYIIFEILMLAGLLVTILIYLGTLDSFKYLLVPTIPAFFIITYIFGCILYPYVISASKLFRKSNCK